MRSWAFRRPALVSCLLTLAACDVVDPWLAPGAEEFAPPPVYERWWSMVESCSGLSRPMGEVPFYVVRGANSIPLENGDGVAAYWSPAGDWIVVAEYYQMFGSVVRHEMLHALLRRTGHAREIFLDRCAGVALCGPTCRRDAGPAPVPSASMPRLHPSDLALGLEVSPQAPRPSEDQGFFTIIVTARNSSSEAVLVEGGGGFSLEFSGPAGDFFERHPPVAIESFLFAPGETKRQMYDFRIGPSDATGRAYPVGEYVMRGAYGNVWSASRTLTLVP